MRIDEAKNLLLDISCDFPFADIADGKHRSAWIAALITLLSRQAFTGPAPFFLFDANASRVGKGLLTDILIMIIAGQRASRYAFPHDQDELRKLITSVAMSGALYLLLDNIKGKLGGSTIENALTTTRWIDRLLGFNREINIPLNFVWLGTVNNATLTTDMAGRTLLCRMETDLERPELRADFKYPDLLGYVKEHRKELATAALSIPANYIKAGRPDMHLPAWGGFEQWSNLVRNSIVWAGFSDPDTREALIEDADD